MKAAIITDIHFGIRGDAEIFLDCLESFFSENFFPYLEANDIKTIFHLGDTFDRRSQIKYSTLVKSKEIFFNKLKGYDYYTIIGNHDTVYRNTNYPNSVQELLSAEYPDFYIITEPTEMRLGSSKILWMPWIPDDKKIEEAYMKVIEDSHAQILFGHFDIAGFLKEKGVVVNFGIDPKKFAKFEIVGSGHYHHRSTKDNIWYFGSPHQATWNDYGNERGFHILDLDTRYIEFIPNKFEKFQYLEYDEDNVPDLKQFNLSNTFVKVNVIKNDDRIKFEAFMLQLEHTNPFKVDVIDKRDYTADKVPEIDDVKDTKKIITEYVKALDLEEEKTESLTDFCLELYQEAIFLKV